MAACFILLGSDGRWVQFTLFTSQAEATKEFIQHIFAENTQYFEFQ